MRHPYNTTTYEARRKTPFAALGAPTVVLWLPGRRRSNPGHCRRCGYNLTGNISGICPECGEPTTMTCAPPA